MSKQISNNNIFKMAQDFKSYVEKTKKLPYKLTYNGVDFYTMEMQDIMTYCLLNLKSGCTCGNTKWCENAYGDSINEKIYPEDYLDQAKRVHDFVLKHNQMPNYVTSVKSKKKVNIDLFSYCVAKILVFYKNNGQLPNYCVYDSSNVDMPTSNNTSKTTNNSSSSSNVIKTSISGIRYGYWVFGRDMYNVNLESLRSNGFTDVFLNYYAVDTHGVQKVSNWVQEVNKYNINVHIWVQCFYDGEWHNPKTTDLTSKKNEIRRYSQINGVKGIHLDYLRYPGTAYKTDGGTNAITQFVREVRNENPQMILTCAVMPENENIKYYGQDIEALGKIVDAVVPMQYKGNYKSGTSWLESTTKNFSSKAVIWSGLQTYKSDNDTSLLSVDELKNDVNACLSNGAKGVMLFRYGLCPEIKFKVEEKKMSKITTNLKVNLLKSKSNKDYILAILTDTKGNPIKNVPIGFADNGVKYVNTDDSGKSRYFPNKTTDGTYNFKVAFFGNDKYEASEKIPVKLWVGKIPSKLNIVREGNYIVATLTDADNKPISGVSVGFADNGVKYITTDKEGKAKYKITQTKEGSYSMKVAFFGNDKYKETEKYTFKFTIKNETPSVTLKPYLTNQGCSGMGQCTGYYCAPNSLQQCFYRLTGILVSESTIASVAGTTSVGTDHQGINTAVEWFNRKYGKNIKITWKSFSEVGWTGLQNAINNGAVFCHIWYRDQWGHYEVPKQVNSDTISVLNSLGDSCGGGTYCGYIETRNKSTHQRYINGISQKSLAILTL